jgi:hypothetical protein
MVLLAVSSAAESAAIQSEEQPEDTSAEPSTQLVLPQFPISPLPETDPAEDPGSSVFVPTILPLFTGGTDDEDAVLRQVGDIRFEMVECPAPTGEPSDDHRLVRGYLAKVPSDWRNRASLINGVLVRAAKFGWETCPHPYISVGEPQDHFHYDIGRVEIYDPADTLMFSASLGGKPFSEQGDQWWFASTHGYQWQHFEAAPEPPSPPTPTIEPVAAAVEVAPAASVQWPAPIDFSLIYTLIKICVLLVIAGVLVAHHEAILCFLYSLKPHPAKVMVDAAIRDGAPINGHLYDELTTVQEGNRFLAKVRDQQASVLTARLRQHETALRAEEIRQVQAALDRVKREEERLRAHSQLRQAGIDHEVAAARLDEVKRSTRG